jgi:autotransporter-associated beta strand protein
VRIQAGVLQISADNNLGDTGNIVRLEGGVLRAADTFAADSARVFRVDGPGGAIDVAAGNTLTLNTADRLRGSAALTKTGAGTLALNQGNTNYTGDASLSGGTTRLGDRQALGANASATHTVGPGATLEAAFADGTNFQANLVLAGGTLVRTSTANQKAGFQNNNAGSSLTVTADSVVRDASNDNNNGFLNFDGVVDIQSGARLVADAATASSEVRFGGSQNIVLASGATLETTGSGLVSLGSASARVLVGQGTAANQSTLILGAADHTSNTGSRFQVDGSGVGGLRVEGTQARVDAFATDARLAATTGSGGTLTIAYTDAGGRTLGVTANLAAAGNVMLGLESAGGSFDLAGSLANWGGLVVGPSTTVSFSAENVFGAEDALVMRGGTITLGDTSQTFASFEVVGSSVLDFGSGDGTLTVGGLNIADGATLTVRNWTESADYFFSQFDPGEANLARVYFEAQDKSGAWNKYGDPFEITPVPEPAAYGALALGGLVGWVALRRRRRA